MNSSEKSRSSAFPYRAMEHFQNKLFILYWKNAEPRKISFSMVVFLWVETRYWTMNVVYGLTFSEDLVEAKLPMNN